jgi:hypothetical protein
MSLALRSIVALIAAWTAYLFWVAVGLALIVASGYSWAHTDERPVMPAIFGCLMLYWLSFLVRPVHPRGVPVSRETAPALWAVLDEEADRVGAQRPRVLLLNPESCDIGIYRTATWARRTSVVSVGIPLLRLYPVGVLRSALAMAFSSTVRQAAPGAGRVCLVGAVLESSTADRGLLARIVYWPVAYVVALLARPVFRAEVLRQDACAARAGGMSAWEQLITSVAAEAEVYRAYWRSEVLPMLAAGNRPPIRDGYRLYVASERAQSIRRAATAGLEFPGRLRLWPTLVERRDAVGRLAGLPCPSSDGPALSLLGEDIDYESSIVDFASGGRFRTVSWTGGYDLSLPANWATQVRYYRRGLRRIKPKDLPKVARKPAIVAKRWAFMRADITELKKEMEPAVAIQAVGPALALAFISAGYSPTSSPGEDVLLCRGDASVNPFDVLPALMDGRLSAEEWLRIAEEAGITDVDLGRAADGEKANR